MTIEYLIYGIPNGETESYTEDLLVTGISSADKATAIITKIEEFKTHHTFRIAKFNSDDAPDFKGTVNL